METSDNPHLSALILDGPAALISEAVMAADKALKPMAIKVGALAKHGATMIVHSPDKSEVELSIRSNDFNEAVADAAGHSSNDTWLCSLNHYVEQRTHRIEEERQEVDCRSPKGYSQMRDNRDTRSGSDDDTPVQIWSIKEMMNPNGNTPTRISSSARISSKDTPGKKALNEITEDGYSISPTHGTISTTETEDCPHHDPENYQKENHTKLLNRSKGSLGQWTVEDLELMMDARVKRQVDASMKKVLQRHAQADSQEQHKLLPASSQDPEEGALADDQAGKEPEKEIQWHSPFGESTYSLLYLCPFKSQGFWFAVFMYVLQIGAIVLTLADIIEWRSEDNPLRIPPMVGMTVTIAQGLTVFMSIAFLGDFLDATLKLQAGFYAGVLETHPGATFASWLGSCIAQLIAGSLLLVIICILTMQVTTVLDIMLNFAALHFMNTIDDIGFAMAKLGFVNQTLQADVEAVLDVKVPKFKSRSRCRRILYFIAMAGTFTLYAVIKKRQLDGHFLPTNLYVRLGDPSDPNSKVPYSGSLYKFESAQIAGYRQYRGDGASNSYILGYCKEENSWTFSKSGDPCVYVVKSQETQSFDVTSVSNSEWQYVDDFGRLQPLKHFSLISRDCDEKICQGTCGVDGLCLCPHDRTGFNCEFKESDSCPELLAPFPSVEIQPDHLEWGIYKSISISGRFHRLKNPATEEYVKVNNMPVYYSSGPSLNFYIFFENHHWIVSSALDLFDEDSRGTTSTAESLPLFKSDPVDFEDEDFHPSPINLGWWTVKKVDETGTHFVHDAPVDTVLTCWNDPREESALTAQSTFQASP